MLTEVNIGMVGHVDHGKTSLVQALTGVWTSKYAEEIKRGISIRLGYADAVFYQCQNDGVWCSTARCPKCNSQTEPKRAVSFIDAPGHETLMATVLSGASLMDGAILVIAANEICPQPQTAEHLKALDIAGIEKIIIVQNKVDIVTEEIAQKNYEDIKKFVKGTVAEDAPIIPVSALHNANIDVLIETIQKTIPTPKRDLRDDPRFYIARSFDINKPGTPIDDLVGGVIGGSLTQGSLKLGDEIEIVPGIKSNASYKSIKTRIVNIFQAGKSREVAVPGGLVSLGTELDPSLTRGDIMAGSVAGLPLKLPQCCDKIKFKPNLFPYIIGIDGQQPVKPIHTGDVLMITAAIAKSVGMVTSASKSNAELKLKIPICILGQKIALARQVSGRWHLIGWGEVINNEKQPS